MIINQLEDRLFAQYTEPIVKDGMVDEEAYLSAPVRILFLMKDPVGDVGEKWNHDLRVFAGDGSRPDTWNQAMRCVKILLGEKNEFPVDQEKQKEERTKYARKIIWMNGKKTPGNNTVKNTTLENEVLAHKDLLNKQLAIYNKPNYTPQIIYCGCGSYNIYGALKEIPDCQWKHDTCTFGTESKRGIYYWLDEQNWLTPCLVIRGAHPGRKGKKLFDELVKFLAFIKQTEMAQKIGL